jgi:hypothetical protein
MIFRFRWYLFALFLYWASFFLRRVSVSLLLALLIIVAIALFHSDGMSFILENPLVVVLLQLAEWMDCRVGLLASRWGGKI